MSDGDIWNRYPSICHYTKYETVFKILDNKILYASHFEKLDDPSEIIHAKNMMIEYLSKFDKTLPKRAVTDSYDRYLTDVYISSFTKPDIKLGLKENDGILSMWRFYGAYSKEDEGGCCIEFDSKKLYKKYYQYISEKMPSATALIFDEVQYEEICKEEISLKLKQYLQCLKNLKSKYDTGSSYEKELREYVSAFISCISLFKHQAFFEEREIRIVFFVTHRLVSIKQASRIFVLENAELVGVGTHHHLMEHNLLYNRMFSAQSKNYLF